MRRLAAGLLACAAALAAADDSMPRSLTGVPGDPLRGRAIVANRQAGLCLLCHSAPIPEERFQGDLAPDLRSSSLLTEGQIRLRIVDPARANPLTIMPAFHRTEGLERVAPTHAGKPILTAQQVEDVVSWLVSLR